MSYGLDCYVIRDSHRDTTFVPRRSDPVRTCVGCRQRGSMGELLRVAVVDGQAVVDEHRRLPGRGAWLHPDPQCLSTAERRRAFPRALRVSGSLNACEVRHYLERLIMRAGTGDVLPDQ